MSFLFALFILPRLKKAPRLASAHGVSNGSRSSLYSAVAVRAQRSATITIDNSRDRKLRRSNCRTVIEHLVVGQYEFGQGRCGQSSRFSISRWVSHPSASALTSTRVVGAASTADAPVLVLVLDPNLERVESFVRELARGVYSRIMTCNNALGCLDLARRHKPRIVFIHSSEAVVEGVSLVELIHALSPQSDVRVLD